MNGAHFAWELFKLTLGIILIMAAAIYCVAHFLGSVMKIDAYSPNLCSAEAQLEYTNGAYWVSCDRPVGHDGYHHDDEFNLDWSDEPAEVAP
jgi:hypothetical protein